MIVCKIQKMISAQKMSSLNNVSCGRQERRRPDASIFLSSEATINDIAYTDMLKLLITRIIRQRRYIFQQDSAPFHTHQKIK